MQKHRNIRNLTMLSLRAVTIICNCSMPNFVGTWTKTRLSQDPNLGGREYEFGLFLKGGDFSNGTYLWLFSLGMLTGIFIFIKRARSVDLLGSDNLVVRFSVSSTYDLRVFASYVQDFGSWCSCVKQVVEKYCSLNDDWFFFASAFR